MVEGDYIQILIKQNVGSYLNHLNGQFKICVGDACLH